MLEHVFQAVTFATLTYASLHDLRTHKTTYTILAVMLANGVLNIILNGGLFDKTSSCFAMLLFGFVAWWLGYWGDGDAAIIALTFLNTGGLLTLQNGFLITYLLTLATFLLFFGMMRIKKVAFIPVLLISYTTSTVTVLTNA